MLSDSDIIKQKDFRKRKNHEDNSLLFVLLDIRRLLAKQVGEEIPESDPGIMAQMTGELPDVPENHPAANAGGAPIGDIASPFEVKLIAAAVKTAPVATTSVIDSDAVSIEQQQAQRARIQIINEDLGHASTEVEKEVKSVRVSDEIEVSGALLLGQVN